MIRGALSNNLQPSLWIDSKVLLTTRKRKWLPFLSEEQLRRESWLWAVSYFTQPIIIYIDTKPSRLLHDYQSMSFVSYADCRQALSKDLRAVELIVDDPAHVGRDCTLYTPDILKRYS